MAEKFEIRWDRQLAATPREVWTAITERSDGWLWPIEFEPREGGTEHGLGGQPGTVTVWEPEQHFTTSSAEPDGTNELDYVLEPRNGGTYLRYTHRGVFATDFETNLDACKQHTDFYYHSLGEYVRHFAGRSATYVAADGPESSAQGGFAEMRRALGVPDGAAVGDTVRLTPEGMEPIDGVVDYATPVFLGVRSANALYRFYGRDHWGWPAGVAHHLYDGTDGKGWSQWLAGVFADGRMA
ncbi:SRPBCC family protein [Pseudonocardia sp. TRM90224]|uniref:SRPBCC family protein n=1 Tax=Pseudonocardia sp. TRM90224 TaxID=2812678 RepID=UPI001E4611A7|nr:SRPBCC domain-containing protein [Pseudonocardia sp. TRM90224]